MKATRLVRAIARNAALPVLAGCLILAQQAVIAAPGGNRVAPFGIGGSDFAAATQSDLLALAESDLMLVGPVEAVDYNAGVLQVLGQRVTVSRSGGTSRALHRALLRAQLSKVVEVRGRLLGEGQVEATSISVTARHYVPGAHTLFLRGLIGAVDSSIGRLSVGQLVVDYTGTLHSLDSISVVVGAEFVAAGIQPSRIDSLVALVAVAKAIDGIGGSDLNGIGGSDLNGIGGSDLNGIGGSDLNGIGGSDLNGIGGSDLNGIGGSDF